MMRHVESRFWIGDIVYRRTDNSNEQGLVIGVTFEGSVIYEVSFDGRSNTYREIELDDVPSWKVDPEIDDKDEP